MPQDVVPEGFVGLAQAIDSLRTELYAAMIGSSQRELRFHVSNVELSLEVAVTNSTEIGGGIRWWIVEAKGDRISEKVSTQSLKLQLEPKFIDSEGKEIDALISGHRSPASPKTESAPGGGRR